MVRYFSVSPIAYLTKKQLPNLPILPFREANKFKDSISKFFIDHKLTIIKAGNGGNGNVSFLNTKEKALAGPDGGDGGNGGHIIFQSNANLKSLNKLKSKYEAQSGIGGQPFHMKGKNGENLVIQVPVGTLIKNKNNEFVFEFNKNKSQFIAARGGTGGKGNAYFLSNERRAPSDYECGHKGEEYSLKIELKLIADAALIGYPNVGKSSLLNAITKTRVKIGNFSFTTLHPHVGVVEYEDFTKIFVADLPGILPDLSRGFGTKYLHHLEKCRMVIIIIDLASNDSFEQYQNVVRILNSFDENILRTKPLIVVGNKVDEKCAYENYLVLTKRIDNPIIPISTKQNINLKKFMSILRNVYEKDIIE